MSALHISEFSLKPYSRMRSSSILGFSPCRFEEGRCSELHIVLVYPLSLLESCKSNYMFAGVSFENLYFEPLKVLQFVGYSACDVATLNQANEISLSSQTAFSLSS